MFKEISRSSLQIFDSDKISLSSRNEINPITAIYPNSGASDVVNIEIVLEEMGLVIEPVETILVNLLIPPYIAYKLYANMYNIV
jgi:hypothetical protein